jgi:hypothetical protein
MKSNMIGGYRVEQKKSKTQLRMLQNKMSATILIFPLPSHQKRNCYDDKLDLSRELSPMEERRRAKEKSKK